MKKILIVLVCAFTLSACGSQYLVTTKSGEEIKTQGKPKLEEDTAMYRYTDIDGHDVLIKQDEVVQIKEL